MKKHFIQFPDFLNLDIRVGKVVDAKRLESSSKLLELQVDLGEDYGVVTILAGMAQFFTPEDFIGKHFAFVANLEPKEMAGSTSNGMMLAADVENKPVLLELSSSIPPGSPIR